jgi:hypothetical protein
MSPKITLIGLAILHSAVSAALPHWAPGPQGDLNFETSDFLKSTAYRNPDRVALELNDTGAYSPVNQAWDRTHQGKWFIEEQRYALDAVVVGLAYGRQDLIDRGRKIFDWGFRQEKTDGSFDCPDRFHSASFFIEAASHAALLLQASPMRSANQAWVDAIKPKLALAVGWMLDPKNEAPGRDHDRPYTHRNYLDAAAIGETGVLAGNQAFIEASKRYVRDGLSRQDPSGFNPEKGGYDTSYHAVGLLFALDYYTLVADERTRRELKPMIEKGLDWLKARTRQDGTVDQSGNTRTGGGQEVGRNGTKKYMSYGSAYRAAYYWAMITSDSKWADYAQKLFEGDHIERKSRAP